jgi:hypothetical protein
MVNKKSDLISSLIKTIVRRLSIVLCIILPLFHYSLASANSTLEASVDRNKLYLNESFNLKLTGSVEVDFSFGGLMNFGMNQVDAPEFDDLEENFNILDRQQNYSMRSINGNTTTEVTWNYTLSPKRSGTLTIPKASIKDAESQPISIHVLEGKAPINADNPPSAFIEVEVDKDQIYVQEQVVYTVRLFSLGRLSGGSLSEPTTSEAIIEPFGEESKYYRMAYNQRYEVIERNYLIFPQKSGLLEIPALSFNGTMIDSYKRRRVRIAEMSNPLSLDVTAPNSEFSGEHWLPAKSLHLSEKWQNNNNEYFVGDAITREITVSALGLLGSALPPIKGIKSQAVKSYPDKPIVESNIHEAGSQAFRKEATTYIAVTEGSITLPEVQIPWWDTVNDIARLATLPAKTIKINANATPQVDKANSLIDLTDNTTANDPTFNNQNPSLTSNLSTGNSSTDRFNTDNANNNEESSNHALLSIIVLLVLGWLLTSWFLLSRLRAIKLDLEKLSKQHQELPTETELSYKQVIDAIKSGSTNMPKLVISWVGKSTGANRELSTLSELSRIDNELASEIIAFEELKYGNKSENSYDPTALIQRLKQYQKKTSATQTNKPYELRAFYPQ